MLRLNKPTGAKIITVTDGTTSLSTDSSDGAGSFAVTNTTRIDFSASVSTTDINSGTKYTTSTFSIPYNTLASIANYGVAIFNAYGSFNAFAGGYSGNGSSSVSLKLTDGTTTHTICSLSNTVVSASSNTYQPNLTKTGFLSNIYIDFKNKIFLTGNGTMDDESVASQYTNTTTVGMIANNTSFAALNLDIATVQVIATAGGYETTSGGNGGGGGSGYFTLVCAKGLV